MSDIRVRYKDGKNAFLDEIRTDPKYKFENMKLWS